MSGELVPTERLCFRLGPGKKKTSTSIISCNVSCRQLRLDLVQDLVWPPPYSVQEGRRLSTSCLHRNGAEDGAGLFFETLFHRLDEGRAEQFHLTY